MGDGWMHGKMMDRWLDGWMHGWMDAWMDGYLGLEDKIIELKRGYKICSTKITVIVYL